MHNRLRLLFTGKLPQLQTLSLFLFLSRSLSVPRCASSYQSVSKPLVHFSLLSLGRLNKLLLAKKHNFRRLLKYYNELQMLHTLCSSWADATRPPTRDRGECRQWIHWLHTLCFLTAVIRVNQSGMVGKWPTCVYKQDHDWRIICLNLLSSPQTNAYFYLHFQQV